jgi:hypothetical protein
MKKMRNVILHVGYPKTATTWFQKEFYPKVENFRYFKRKEFKTFFKKDEDFLKFVKQKYSFYDFIICEEHLIMRRDIEAKDEDIVKIKAERLKQAFDFANVTIVIFIRNQIDILESAYSESIKQGDTKSLNEYLDNLIKSGKIEQWDYYSQIKIYRDYFGKSNVKVFLYEDFKNNNVDFLQNYIDELKLDINIKEINIENINKSIHIYLIPLIILLNKVQKVLGKKRNTFFVKMYMRINNRLYFNKKEISQSMKKYIWQFFLESNRKLISEFGLNLKKYNYPH